MESSVFILSGDNFFQQDLLFKAAAGGSFFMLDFQYLFFAVAGRHDQGIHDL